MLGPNFGRETHKHAFRFDFIVHPHLPSHSFNFARGGRRGVAISYSWVVSFDDITAGPGVLRRAAAQNFWSSLSLVFSDPVLGLTRDKHDRETYNHNNC